MTIQYTWQITSADGKVNEVTGLVNVVKILNWTCIGKVVGTPACFGHTGWTILNDPDPGNFIEYSSLTEHDLLNWAQANGTKEKIEQLVADALEGADELARIAAGVTCLPRFWKDESPYPETPEIPVPAPADPSLPELPTYIAPDIS